MFVLAVDPRKITLRFDEFPQQAHKTLLARITSLTQELEARIKAAEPRLSGRLVKDTASSVRDKPERISGTVRITADFAKAAALEYGAHGSTAIQAHSAALDHVYARMISPMVVIVAAHTRRVSIAQHEFLRGPLGAMQSEFKKQIEDALAEALGETA